MNRFQYGKERPLFRDLQFSLDTKSRVAVVGPNGAGKTTLLKLVTKQLEPNVPCSDRDAGTGLGANGEVNHHRHLVIGRYDQHFEESLPAATSPVEFLEATYDLQREEAHKYLGMFGLDSARHKIKVSGSVGGWVGQSLRKI
jgi:ATPase subunit of ABC transporter with duplicated ATPase domains